MASVPPVSTESRLILIVERMKTDLFVLYVAHPSSQTGPFKYTLIHHTVSQAQQSPPHVQLVSAHATHQMRVPL